MKVRAHLIIHGRVQGVFYRRWCLENARELNLTGWVRNRDDGTVEAVFEGEEENVREMIERCHEGPPRAVVTKIDVKFEKPKEEFRDFRIIY
ncbi:MAG: acylphosphatase [Archaeoglobi archaeon]|nr:acylphosphatase [Candidatus Mnemosynella bozhongmuii]